MSEQAVDFRDESEALYRLVAPLRDADYARVTQFKQWTIADVITHLHVWNEAARIALVDEPAFVAYYAEVTAARARVVPHAALVWRHAWPASLRPVCAVFGEAIGTLLSGSFVVEYVTTWPGLGRLMYEALRARDIYLVAGCAAAG
jgi:uncharacterized protein (TIGR03083 family)